MSYETSRKGGALVGKRACSVARQHKRKKAAEEEKKDGEENTYSSLLEYASCLPSGMVMHWKTAIPPSLLST